MPQTGLHGNFIYVPKVCNDFMSTRKITFCASIVNNLCIYYLCFLKEKELNINIFINILRI